MRYTITYYSDWSLPITHTTNSYTVATQIAKRGKKRNYWTEIKDNVNDIVLDNIVAINQ